MAQPTTQQVKVLLFLRAFPLFSRGAGRKRFWVGRDSGWEEIMLEPSRNLPDPQGVLTSLIADLAR